MRLKQKKRYDGRNYTILSGKDSDGSGDETELQLKKSRFKEVPTVEKIVEEGDTLQALALRYGITIAELKRLNKIHKENEIYAKRTVKIPLRHFAIPGIHSGDVSPENKSSSKKYHHITSLNTALNKTLLNISSASQAAEFNEIIFNSSYVKSNSDTAVNEICDEEISLLPQAIPIEEKSQTWYSCSGADADISWIGLIICVVILVFALPLIYVLYIAEHPEEYHQEHL